MRSRARPTSAKTTTPDTPEDGEAAGRASAPVPVPVPAAAPAPASRRPAPAADPHETLERLRRGLPPAPEHLDSLTVGFDGVKGRLDALLEEVSAGGGGFLVARAHYGAGKSHAVELARARALDRGFVVGRAEIDLTQSRAEQPRSVYASLLHGLEVKGESGAVEPLGILDLLERLARDDRARSDYGQPRAAGGHPQLGGTLEIVRHLARDGIEPWLRDRGRELLRRYLTGEMRSMHLFEGLPGASQLRSILPYRNAADCICFVLSGLAHALRTYGGRPGMLLLVDEAERSEYARRAELARTFLEGLLYAAGWDAPAARGWAGALAHNRVNPYPYRFREAANGLGVVLTFAAEPLGGGGTPLQEALLAQLPPERVLELPGVGERDLARLLGRVETLYRRAFADRAGGVRPLDAEDRERIARRLVETYPRREAMRERLRSLVKCLDVRYHEGEIAAGAPPGEVDIAPPGEA